ncbi:Hexokinase-1, partial [Ananas comosus]
MQLPNMRERDVTLPRSPRSTITSTRWRRNHRMRKSAAAAAAAVAAGAAFAAAALWYRRSSRRWRRAELIMRELKEPCETSVERLWAVADAMADEMRAGIASEGRTSLRMIADPSISLPTGCEEGLFYGLQFGPASVRMIRLLLGGNDARVVEKEISEVPVPPKLMVGTSEELYNFIAAELVKFISTGNANMGPHDGMPGEIGVTFSFPVVQDLESDYFSVEWTIGFSIKETANDTVGILAGGRYCCKETVAAVMLGMKTNAAYTEPFDGENPHNKHRDTVSSSFILIELLQYDHIINMELGNFKSPNLPITEFDTDLDAASANPGEQIFAKLVCGVYLGDIVRRVLLKMAEETALFGDTIPSKLRIPFVLKIPDMAAMHQDMSEDLMVVGEKLDQILGIPNTTLRMRKLVFEVCEIVTRRGAYLAAAGILGILKKIGKDSADEKVAVAVEGNIYEHYRLFREYLHNGVEVMLRERVATNVVIQHFNDVSRIGAALLSASNSHN